MATLLFLLVSLYSFLLLPVPIQKLAEKMGSLTILLMNYYFLLNKLETPTIKRHGSYKITGRTNRQLL
jgi:hypothetical protein